MNRYGPNAPPPPDVPVSAKVSETPAPPPPPEPKPPTAEERFLTLEKETKRAAHEAMRRAQDLKRDREELLKRSKEVEDREAKAKEHGTWEESFAKDPARYLEKRLGPDWYDKLSAVKVGGTVTPGMVQLDVEERVSAVAKETKAEIEALRAELKARDERDAQRQQAQTEAQVRQGAESYLAQFVDKYPLIHSFEAQDRIFPVIRAHFDETTRKDDITGEVVPGEVWSAEQAATWMEAELEKKFSKAIEKKRPAPTPSQTVTPAAPAAHRLQTPHRRTLSTDLSGSSSTWVPPKDDKERDARATAAWNAARAH